MGLFMDWKWLFITNCYLLYSYITAVSIWTIEQTLHSLEWHCIRSILTSNYLFLRLFLRTRKHYFSLILFPPIEIYDFPRRHTTSYRRWNDVVCLQGYIYNALQRKHMLDLSRWHSYCAVPIYFCFFSLSTTLLSIYVT